MGKKKKNQAFNSPTRRPPTLGVTAGLSVSREIVEVVDENLTNHEANV